MFVLVLSCITCLHWRALLLPCCLLEVAWRLLYQCPASAWCWCCMTMLFSWCCSCVCRVNDEFECCCHVKPQCWCIWNLGPFHKSWLYVCTSLADVIACDYVIDFMAMLLHCVWSAIEFDIPLLHCPAVLLFLSCQGNLMNMFMLLLLDMHEFVCLVESRCWMRLFENNCCLLHVAGNPLCHAMIICWWWLMLFENDCCLLAKPCC